MTPSAQEVAIRKDLVHRFTTLVETLDSTVTVLPVGLYVMGLFLPTSNIDMVLRRCSGLSFYTGVLTLYPKILRSGFSSGIVTVFNASVPVMKITDKLTGIEIDLSGADSHSIKATDAVVKWMKKDTEIVKMLVFVVKTFLMVRKCGTTYTGGVNSYVLVWMVVAWVNLEWRKRTRTQVQPSSTGEENVSSLMTSFGNLSLQRSTTSSASSALVSTRQSSFPTTQNIPTADPDYGEALKGFLSFYAQHFDYRSHAIIIEPEPRYKAKTSAYLHYPTQQFLLSIFDPADATVDMGSKAYGINHIKASFQEAYSTISNSGSAVQRGRPLSIMLGGDFTKFVEKRARITRNFKQNAMAFTIAQ